MIAPGLVSLMSVIVPHYPQPHLLVHDKEVNLLGKLAGRIAKDRSDAKRFPRYPQFLHTIHKPRLGTSPIPAKWIVRQRGSYVIVMPTA